jgi:group I intron endonuclease
MEEKRYYIYKITLLCGSLSNHYYYGMHKRKSLNIDPLDDKYYGSGKIVNNYYEKYPFEQGVTAIKEIVEYNDTKKENAEREEHYIGNLWETDPLCLNLKAGGIGGGGKWSDEQRKKYLSTMTGHITTDETKEKISKANTGKKRTAEAKAKMSAAKKGKSTSWKGKHHTIESNEKNRLSHIGKKHTEEWKKNMSEKMKGIPHPSPSEETRRKISEANKGNSCGHPKAVNMIDKNNGQILNTFPSIKDAAIYLGGEKNKGNICMCCNGKLKSACGYKWEYKKAG